MRVRWKNRKVVTTAQFLFSSDFFLTSQLSLWPSLLKLSTIQRLRDWVHSYSLWTNLLWVLLQGSTLFSVILRPRVMIVQVGFEKRSHSRNSTLINWAKLVADGILVFLASQDVEFDCRFLTKPEEKILIVICGGNFWREEFIFSLGQAQWFRRHSLGCTIASCKQTVFLFQRQQEWSQIFILHVVTIWCIPQPFFRLTHNVELPVSRQ